MQGLAPKRHKSPSPRVTESPAPFPCPPQAGREPPAAAPPFWGGGAQEPLPPLKGTLSGRPLDTPSLPLRPRTTKPHLAVLELGRGPIGLRHLPAFPSPCAGSAFTRVRGSEKPPRPRNAPAAAGGPIPERELRRKASVGTQDAGRVRKLRSELRSSLSGAGRGAAPSS